MDVYVKPHKVFKAENQRIVKLKDVADVYCTGGNQDKYKELVLLNIQAKERKNYLITIVDIVKAIVRADEKAKVSNIGEMDILVQFVPNPKKENKIVNFLKIAMVTTILFFGAASAIMSFHADADIPKILEGYYEMFYQDDRIPYITEIPYSIGLFVGITLFFNHFSKAQMSLDPTPIEVQMTTYEKEVIANQIDMLDQERER